MTSCLETAYSESSQWLAFGRAVVGNDLDDLGRYDELLLKGTKVRASI